MMNGIEEKKGGSVKESGNDQTVYLDCCREIRKRSSTLTLTLKLKHKAQCHFVGLRISLPCALTWIIIPSKYHSPKETL